MKWYVREQGAMDFSGVLCNFFDCAKKRKKEKKGCHPKHQREKKARETSRAGTTGTDSNQNDMIFTRCRLLPAVLPTSPPQRL